MNMLLKGEYQVSEIHKAIGIRQSIASQLLSNLKFDGILKSRRIGNKTYYSLANDSIKRIMKVIIAEI
jgi:DNA-binding transcriptional ArsR family regulator